MKKALIAGAGKGLGQQVAMRLAEIRVIAAVESYAQVQTRLSLIKALFLGTRAAIDAVSVATTRRCRDTCESQAPRSILLQPRTRRA
jgi:NAD(P)-dependent dehydrogenase (short-subunit alcohol dehydrogenase family)